MSPSEVAELDDWMHEHRIRSRGEAIRRLCQIGMAFEPSIDHIDSIMQSTTKSMADFFSTFDPNNEYDDELFTAFRKLLHAMHATNRYLVNAAVKAHLYRDIEEIKDVRERAAKWDELTAKVYADLDALLFK